MEFTDEYFEQVYNRAIVADLEKKYGSFIQQHVDLQVSSEAMHTMVDKMGRSNNPRRAEAVMVVPDENSRIWLHTKKFYPDGVYRLMTGGLESGERPVVAARREAQEETGFDVEIKRCLGVVTYQFFGVGEPLPFASYLFLTTAGRGYPEPTDPGEKITDFVAVPPAQLTKTARQLRSLEGRFADWGAFRAISHDLAAQALAK